MKFNYDIYALIYIFYALDTLGLFKTVISSGN
jgi:hypothetical protein